MSRKFSPYGSWKSPITSEMVAETAVRLGQVEIEGTDIYWAEMRPSEDGRHVIVKHSPDSKTVDVNPSPFNARTTVHEYGGGAYKVNKDTVYFADFADQRLYKMKLGEKPKAITPKAELRYADLVFDNRRRRIICIREDHREKRDQPVNTIVSMGLEGEDAQVILSGNDFYSSPRISPDGEHLAWITWNHPYMPWDKTELWVGRLCEDVSVGEPIQVAGELEESVLQPLWSPKGVLHFVSDRNGWWNIYSWRDDEIELAHALDAEFATPHWVFAQSNYAFESEQSIICSYTKNAVWHIARLDTQTGSLEVIGTPYTQVSYLKASNGYAVFIGGSPRERSSVVKLDLETCEIEVLKRSSEVHVDPGYISKPRPIEFPTENNQTAHAIYYEPTNRDFAGPTRVLPPLLVFSHGGPTGSTSAALSLGIQFWTSRGFAVVDVNYGGSTGYGREYRQRLYGQWGVMDVDDCVNAARYLVDTRKVDGEKLAIRGGSAGGYTAINALTFRDVFKAGASYYGISDLEVFVKDTHKFESRYLDSLIGAYPERKDLYHDRSAINFLDQIQAPMILFQGLDDKIVPPNQAELIVEALKKKGRPVAYLPFEGEQHGFRQAKNIKRSLEAELYFYGRIFGFKPADPIEPVPIENL
jgi:dipeptidyl aminopeptidase/acylaminoacyl peptidase